MCRDPDAWGRTRDEQNFSWPEAENSHARLQVLTCTHEDAVFVATQVPTDLGPSVINHAERVVEAAAKAMLPDRWPDNLPDLVILMIDEQGETTWYCAEISRPNDGASVPTARFKSSLQWKAVVESHADLDRGCDYMVPEPEQLPWSDVWHTLDLASVIDVRSFRSACLAVDRGLAVRCRLWLHRGRRQCCWYHQRDWRAASALALEQLSVSSTSRKPGDEAVERIKHIQGGPRADCEAAISLLTDPIHVNSGASLTNGQHRVRAMLDQGVQQAPATRSVYNDDLKDALATPGTFPVDSGRSMV